MGAKNDFIRILIRTGQNWTFSIRLTIERYYLKRMINRLIWLRNVLDLTKPSHCCRFTSRNSVKSDHVRFRYGPDRAERPVRRRFVNETTGNGPRPVRPMIWRLQQRAVDERAFRPRTRRTDRFARSYDVHGINLINTMSVHVGARLPPKQQVFGGSDKMLGPIRLQPRKRKKSLKIVEYYSS